MSATTDVCNLPQDEAQAIRKIIERHLRATDLYGTLPTPILDVMAALKIRQDHDLDDFVRAHILSSSPTDAQIRARQNSWGKIKGMADLNRRSVYCPPLKTAQQDNWRNAHELAHLTLPWHKLGAENIYREDSSILNQQNSDRFECEANCGASSYIYQPQIFVPEVNDLPLTFDSIRAIAPRYGGSLKSTFINAIHARRDDCLGITYLKNNWMRSSGGIPIFQKPITVMSPTFEERGYPWVAPLQCRTDWAGAYAEGGEVNGDATIGLGDEFFLFNWSALWTGFDLMVLLKLQRSSFKIAVPNTPESLFPSTSPALTKIFTR